MGDSSSAIAPKFRLVDDQKNGFTYWVIKVKDLDPKLALAYRSRLIRSGNEYQVWGDLPEGLGGTAPDKPPTPEQKPAPATVIVDVSETKSDPDALRGLTDALAASLGYTQVTTIPIPAGENPLEFAAGLDVQTIADAIANNTRPLSPATDLETILDNRKPGEDPLNVAGKALIRISDAALERMKKWRDSLAQEVKHLTRPFGNVTPTRKRFDEYKSRMEEGRKKRFLLSCLSKYIEHQESGGVGVLLLSKLTQKNVIEYLCAHPSFPGEGSYYESERNGLIKAGITAENYEEAHGLFQAYGDFDLLNETKQERVERTSLEIIMQRPPGYFPTPDDVIDVMLNGIIFETKHDTLRVLEPSAGSGNIARHLREHLADIEDAVLHVIERYRPLLQMLRDQDFIVINDDDFLEFHIENVERDGYDIIALNPPFENKAHMDHVQHAYSLLRSGGQLSAIVPNGTLTGSDKKSKAFKEWFDDLGGTQFRLPPDAFKPSGTNVATLAIWLYKPDADGEVRSAPEIESKLEPEEKRIDVGQAWKESQTARKLADQASVNVQVHLKDMGYVTEERIQPYYDQMSIQIRRYDVVIHPEYGAGVFVKWDTKQVDHVVIQYAQDQLIAPVSEIDVRKVSDVSLTFDQRNVLVTMWRQAHPVWKVTTQPAQTKLDKNADVLVEKGYLHRVQILDDEPTGLVLSDEGAIAVGLKEKPTIWRYGMRNRPALEAAPSGWSNPQLHKDFDFGTVDYPSMLTPRQLYDFEMVLVEPLPDLPLYKPGTIVKFFSTGKEYEIELLEGEYWANDPIPIEPHWRSVQRWHQFEVIGFKTYTSISYPSGDSLKTRWKIVHVDTDTVVAEGLLSIFQCESVIELLNKCGIDIHREGDLQRAQEIVASWDVGTPDSQIIAANSAGQKNAPDEPAIMTAVLGPKPPTATLASLSEIDDVAEFADDFSRAIIGPEDETDRWVSQVDQLAREIDAGRGDLNQYVQVASGGTLGSLDDLKTRLRDALDALGTTK